MPISTIDSNGLTNPLTSGVTTNTITSAAATALTLKSAGTTAVTIDTSQNVGIGTSSPTSGKLVISGTSVTTSQGIRLVGDTADARFICESATLGAGILGTFSNHAQLFYTNSTERMRIDSSGNLLVGQTATVLTGTIQFTYDGSSRQGMCIKNSANSQNGAAIRFIDYTNASSGGGIFFTSSNAITYATSSDYRLKTNIVPMTGALAKVQQLKPVTFNWKQDNSASQGFIAHELQDIIPEAVIGTKDAVDADGKPMYQGVDTSYIVATLTAAIQELKSIVDAQAAEIAELKAKVA